MICVPDYQLICSKLKTRGRLVIDVVIEEEMREKLKERSNRSGNNGGKWGIGIEGEGELEGVSKMALRIGKHLMS